MHNGSSKTKLPLESSRKQEKGRTFSFGAVWSSSAPDVSEVGGEELQGDCSKHREESGVSSGKTALGLSLAVVGVNKGWKALSQPLCECGTCACNILMLHGRQVPLVIQSWGDS